MIMRIHPHASERMKERGATLDEVKRTLAEGERFSAGGGRAGYTKTFAGEGAREGETRRGKRLDVLSREDNGTLTVIHVSVKFVREGDHEHHL